MDIILLATEINLDLKIDWKIPSKKIVLSEKDKKLSSFKSFSSKESIYLLTNELNKISISLVPL